jgi:hypothetical protein
MSYLSLTLRIGLAAVCLAAVLGKAHGRASLRAFVTSIEQVARAVPLVKAPNQFAIMVAAPTLVAELAVAVLLPWPGTTRAGAVLALLLFGTLTAGVWLAVATGVPARCACFGRASRTLAPTHVARNLILTTAATICCLPTGNGWPPWPGTLVSTVAGCAFATVIMAWEDLAALFTPVEARP